MRNDWTPDEINRVKKNYGDASRWIYAYSIPLDLVGILQENTNVEAIGLKVELSLHDYSMLEKEVDKIERMLSAVTGTPGYAVRAALRGYYYHKMNTLIRGLERYFDIRE